jgi:phenylacetate-CoA ligase
LASFLRKNILIPLLEKKRGIRAGEYSAEVFAHLSSSREEMTARQDAKYLAMIRSAATHVPYYQEHFAAHQSALKEGDLRRLKEQLPILTKGDIRKAGGTLLDPRYPRHTLTKSGTGGTTSSPMEFYLDSESMGKRTACTRFFQRWYGHEPGDRMAFLWGATRDFPEGFSWKWHLVNFLTYQQLMLPSNLLNEETLGEFHARLAEFRPVLLQAYSTPMFYLAQYMLEKGLQLSIPNLTTTAEPLSDHQRQIIREAFGSPVFNWYGAREMGHAASECSRHEGLHLNTYGLKFEVLLPDGSVAEEGQGELVVTDLDNFCMPLIRYRIGDTGRLSFRRCSCGSELPFLEEITGRVADVFRRRDGSAVPGISLADRIVEECHEIKEFQIVQDDFEKFTLNIVKGPSYSDQSLTDFQGRIEEYMGTGLQFTVNYLATIPREASGKIRFCKSNL